MLSRRQRQRESGMTLTVSLNAIGGAQKDGIFTSVHIRCLDLTYDENKIKIGYLCVWWKYL